MSPLLAVLLIGLLAGRLVRLVADDTIFELPRRWLEGHLHGKLEILVTCPWCLSFWLTGAVWLPTWAALGLEAPLLVAGAAWWVSCAAYWVTEALARFATAD